MKKQLPLLVFLVMIICSLAGTGLLYGQKNDASTPPVYNIEELLADKLTASGLSGGASANVLSQLAYESNPTLVISNGKFSLWGGDVPVVAAVDAASLEYLFTDHQGYESIRLIRIIVDQPEQLGLNLKLDQLGHFKNLDYVFFVASFDLCPDSPGNTLCESGLVKDMISGTTGEDGLIVVYQIVHQR